MILDEKNEFCDATAAFLDNTNAILGDVIDTHGGNTIGSANVLRDLGAGTPMYWVIQVTTAYSGGTSAQFQLATDSTANLATSRTNHIDTGAIAVATLVSGYTIVRQLPMDATYERYMGNWLTCVGTVTAGAINSFLTKDPAKYVHYNNNV